MEMSQQVMDITTHPQNGRIKATEDYLVIVLRAFKLFVTNSVKGHIEQANESTYQLHIPIPEGDSSLAKFIRHSALQPEEIIILFTALAPHIIPGFFDAIIQQFMPQGGEFPEFGGVKGDNHRGTLPTGETALFLLAGADPSTRLQRLPLFDSNQPLFKHRILSLASVSSSEPVLSGRLILDPEFVEVFTTGKVALPQLSINFPAQHIATQLEWSDLVLSDRTWKQINELQNWINHHNRLMAEWGMGRKLKPGYRALFYGPPGTGKTMTAMLLGKYTRREVFRIDLSMVVSKYIGETEKNLAALFDKAEQKQWILFFDEADAIFGKRTGVRDAHDKYANQEVSYLLQRMEMHAGLTILASNFRNNIDDAFVRRFNSIIYFPAPGKEERLSLWEQSFPNTLTLVEDVDFPSIAANYELTGAHIMNIVQYCCLEALAKKNHSISQADIISGIKRELEKEGK